MNVKEGMKEGNKDNATKRSKRKKVNRAKETVSRK